MSADAQSPYAVARALIDAAHAKDPAYLARTTTSEDASSDASDINHQDELSYADGVESWAIKLLESNPAKSSLLSSGPGGLELVKLAARCQHLERFLTPRSSYPEGKAGYFKWRRSLYVIQANRAAELLQQAGVSTEEQELVKKWVSKTDLQPGKDAGDPGTQLLEDAAVLVFLADQLEDFAEKHEDYTKEKMITILSKTWKKLSPHGKAAAAAIPLEEGLKKMVAEAVGEIDKQTAAAKDMAAQLPRLKSAAEAEAYLQSVAAASSSSSSSSTRADEASSSNLAASSSSTAPTSPPSVFGTRLFREGVDDPKAFNAWDHVEPPPEYLSTIRSLLATQALTRIPTSEAESLYHSQGKPAEYWDHFYSQHEHKFFKDRKWLGSEFPELLECTAEGAGRKRVLEVGCGAGNTVFPLLEKNRNAQLEMYACDYSSEAVQVVRSNALYKDPPVGKCEAFVWDLSSPEGIPPEVNVGEGGEDGLDLICLIFCLSALHPREWAQAALNLKRLLKPGGLILVRDYARYDLPQLRFRKGRMLDDNFYVRGDGTRVYFFTPEELREIFNAGPAPSPHAPSAPTTEDEAPSAAEEATSNGTIPVPPTEAVDAQPISQEPEGIFDFDTLQMALDRRMLVNRKEDKKMYRNWIQTKLRKR
ncbi:S-adenosyl-L-methionine-dependent methyltransferase [Microstroma glucosiphilum]|uniref:S-adenosyl-L-methionine-dependent methyltransferase n=1 Tax=Pseudomicrostroma glucosiphilum TaxID=1684307 RepID=A0A316UEW7_9BASI|nr:S-adenosyl-L-methionine-dependent methyltransferase [Pseudomicrostroma glucosiphilum]PWN23740.1 S-adenosyl-L-methionine-dependent methyltransferase [Pseudomicrostroma glucosiphilum]